jgi:hypothetical protein
MFGKLELPFEALRIIEESSSTSESLQTNFGYIDECGNPLGLKLIALIIFTLQPVYYTKAPGDDECQRAAGIYDCVKTKAPGITDEIQKQLIKDRSTVVVTHIGKHIFLY